MSIDPKGLADKLEKIEAYGDIVKVYASISEVNLIIAALRAYEPPHIHRWEGWVLCSRCGQQEYHPYLVTMEESGGRK